MKTTFIAALLIRLVGAYFVFTGLLGGISAVLASLVGQIAASSAGAGYQRNSSQELSTALVYLAWFIAGCHLIRSSKWWGRLLAKGLDEENV